MFSLNFYPEAPESSNKLDPVPDINGTNYQFVCIPVNLYCLYYIYTTIVGPLLPPRSALSLLWHL